MCLEIRDKSDLKYERNSILERFSIGGFEMEGPMVQGPESGLQLTASKKTRASVL